MKRKQIKTKRNIHKAYIAAFIIILSAIALLTGGCEKKYETPESFIEFEGDISDAIDINMENTELNTEIRSWLDECNAASATSFSTYVLLHTEYGEEQNTYYFLIYRRLLESDFTMTASTLRTSKEEAIELNYTVSNDTTVFAENTLTYIYYKSTKKPILDILETDSEGNSEYAGYLIKNAENNFDFSDN